MPTDPRPRRRRGPGRSLFRRLFVPQLVRIVADRLRASYRGDAVFVSLMGGVGDLVNAFPSIDRLAETHAVDLGTGHDPYRALARANPHVRRVYSPFVYKPIRRAHRRLIERVLGPLYARVVLLDEPDSAWQTRDRHMSAIYAERCGCAPPARGAVYLPPDARERAEALLADLGVKEYVYVVQLVRRGRPHRSWPLAHYHALYARLHERSGLPVLVHTHSSDETGIPDFCRPVPWLDIFTVAALIERARLYIGPDTGPTHIAAALGVPTVAIHLGYPPEATGALGDNVALVRQRRAVDDPALVSPDAVWDAVQRLQVGA
jgi:glycosyl transferase family 9 (putative heptosyltransferase)